MGRVVVHWRETARTIAHAGDSLEAPMTVEQRKAWLRVLAQEIAAWRCQ
jgi:hypothetical protein